MTEKREAPPAFRRLGCALLALGAALAVNSLLGPFALEVIEYRFSETLLNQGIGLDAVSLFGAAPVAVTAGLLALRRHPAGPVLAFVPATFAAYMAPQYVVGPQYLDLAGNNERFFPFHVGILVLGLAVTLLAWRAVDRSRLRPATRAGDRRRSLVLFGVAAFILVGRWLPGIFGLLGGDPTNADYLENPTSYLLIGILDLGLVVPAAVTGGIALLRGTEWARTAAYAVIGWFALVPASVAAMALTMRVNDDPNADPAAVVIFTTAAVVFTVGAALLYRPMVTAASPRPPSRTVR